MLFLYSNKWRTAYENTQVMHNLEIFTVYKRFLVTLVWWGIETYGIIKIQKLKIYSWQGYKCAI